MNKETISLALNELNDKYIETAIRYQGKKVKSKFVKWGTLAACLALVGILGIGTMRYVTRPVYETVTLESGQTIKFFKSPDGAWQSALDMDVDTCQLTEEQTKKIFGDLPVTGGAYVHDSHIIGFSGQLPNDVRVTLSTLYPLIDVDVAGQEEWSTINGVEIKTGYFLTHANSKGVRNAVYYADFCIKDVSVYLEIGGPEQEGEALKTELAKTIEAFIYNVPLDFESISEE